MSSISIGYGYQQTVDLGGNICFTEQTKMNYRLTQYIVSYKCLYNSAFTQIIIQSLPIIIFLTCVIFTIKGMRPHGPQNRGQ